MVFEKLTRAVFILFEKLTRACFFQLALETILYYIVRFCEF